MKSKGRFQLLPLFLSPLLMFAIVLSMTLLSPPVAQAASQTNKTSSTAFTGTSHSVTGSGTPKDSNIKYIGRWDTSSSTVATSYWPGAYFKTAFTGTTVRHLVIV